MLAACPAATVSTPTEDVLQEGGARARFARRRPTVEERMPLLVHRVWMNLDYSPVIGESGKPIGVIAIVVETSQAVHAASAPGERSAASIPRRPRQRSGKKHRRQHYLGHYHSQGRQTP
jgi:hypothetical protein